MRKPSAIGVVVMGAMGLGVSLLGVTPPAADAADGFTVRAVATGGESAPEFLPGFTFAPQSTGVLGIDAAGRVVFRTPVLNASGQHHADAVYQETNQGLRAILVTDEPAPSIGVGGSPGTIVGITDVKTDPNGDSLFFCQLDGGNGGALVSDVDSQLSVVAAEVNSVPGVCGLTDIESAAFPRGTAFFGGRAVFRAESGPSPTCSPAERGGLYRRNGLGNVSIPLAFGDEINVAHDPSETKPVSEGFSHPSVEPGGNAVFRAFYLDPAGREMLVRSGPGGGREILVAAGDPVPGRAGFTWQAFPDVLVDRGSLAQDGIPRIAYVGIEAESQATFVMERIEGIDSEVMRTFTSRRGVDFEGGFNTRLLSATRRRLVVLGDASGSTVSGFKSGVWRYDPLQSGDAQIELVAYTGEAAPGAAGYSLYWIRSVFCDSEARIAFIATITDGSNFEDAVFMEDGNGNLRLAVREGDVIPDGRGGSVRLAQMSAFGDNGSGEAGRGVRFNDRGELVFSAVTDRGPNFGGVFVVSRGNKPPPPPPDPGPGEAEVRVQKTFNGILKFKGSKGDDRVSIRQTGPGTIEIVPGTGTTVNGGSAPVAFQDVTGLVVKLGDGDDELDFGSNSTIRTVVPRNVVFKMGDGDDRVTCENVDFGGSVTVDMNRGGDGAVRFTLAEVERSLRILAKSANVSIEIDDTTVGGATTIKARTSDSCTFDSKDSSFEGPLRYTGSPRGDDSITCDGFDAPMPWTINVGRGDHGDVDLSTTGVFDGAKFTSNSAATTFAVNTTQPRFVTLRGRSEWVARMASAFGELPPSSTSGTAFTFKTRGVGTCRYGFENTRYSRVRIAQTGGDCEWDLANCAGDRLDLKLKGAGVATCTIADVETNDLRMATGSGDDSATLTDSQVAEDIVGKFGAGNDVLRLTRCGVSAMLILFGAGDDCGELSSSLVKLLRGRGGPGQDAIKRTADTVVDDEDHDGVEDSKGVLILAKR